MKLFPFLLLLLCLETGTAQMRNLNTSRQIEQLEELRETVSRRIDTLQLQLQEQAAGIESMHKKLELMRKESSKPERTDISSREYASKSQQELSNITSLVNALQKKFNQRMDSLDKAINLQKDLENKINALEKERSQ